MGRQTFDRIKKTVSVLLAVLFVVSLTASAGAACKESNSNTGLSSSISGLPAGLNLDDIFSGSGFTPSTENDDDDSSFLSQFF
jgi:hypothetical protein